MSYSTVPDWLMDPALLIALRFNFALPANCEAMLSCIVRDYPSDSLFVPIHKDIVGLHVYMFIYLHLTYTQRCMYFCRPICLSILSCVSGPISSYLYGWFGVTYFIWQGDEKPGRPGCGDERYPKHETLTSLTNCKTQGVTPRLPGAFAPQE